MQVRGVLGVHDEDGVECRDLGEGTFELVRVEVAELVDAGGREEALESDDASCSQFGQRTEVLRHGAAPVAHINAELPGRCCSFRGERVHCRRDGHAVERHVEQRRHAACERCCGAGEEALPLRATRFVQVYV